MGRVSAFVRDGGVNVNLCKDGDIRHDKHLLKYCPFCSHQMPEHKLSLSGWSSRGWRQAGEQDERGTV